MFRRRRMLRRSLVTADQLSLLVSANQSMSQGRFLAAAPLFAQVAQAMQASSHPRRAAHLYARAAHAYADGEDAQAAFSCARQALQLFALARMPRRAATFYANITPRLESLGMGAAGSALQAEFGAQIAASPGPLPASPHHAQLPTNCPRCGAPLHADDLTWLDATTTECAYCGSLLRSPG